jgi:hypothetical protein
MSSASVLAYVLDTKHIIIQPDSDWIDVDNHGFQEGDMVDYNGVQCPVFSTIDSSYRVKDIRGISVLANVIKDNGAISQFTFSGDGPGNKPVTMEISMTEADFSAKGLGKSGAIMAAAFLPKCT